MSRARSAAPPARRTALCALGLALAGGALADPADYVFAPYSKAGARYVSWSAGIARGRDGERETQQSLGLAWSPTARWFTSGYAAWASTDGSGYSIDEWSWLNHVQLTTPGAGPFDIGLLAKVERPHGRAAGTGLVIGPTLQLDTDLLQVNANPLLEKQVNAAESGPAELAYQWQVKHLWGPRLEIGAQGFGNVGPWNRWSPAAQQQHTLGPALFAKWTLPDGRPLKLDAAVLLGVGSGSPRTVLRLRLEHEF